MTNIFIRNDDVRETLDKSLIEITEICLTNKVPISHAIEPANVSIEVVEWLTDLKKKYPNLIEIIQHGYDHKIKYHLVKYGKIKQGEFGGKRTFNDQYCDLKKGYDLMDNYFGTLWFPILTLPYGSFNNNTFRTMEKIGYKGLSTSVNFSRKHQIKNFIGNLLNLNSILCRQISYHMKKRPGTSFLDASVSVNIIKTYLNENDAVHYNNKEIIDKIKFNSKYTKNIGLLLHHRFHDDIINQISDLIRELKKSNTYNFKRIEEVIC